MSSIVEAAAGMVRWLLERVSVLQHDVWWLLVTILEHPVGKWAAGAVGGFVIPALLVALPLVWPRRLAYGLKKTPYFGLKLGKVCFARGNRQLRRGRLQPALAHLDLAIQALAEIRTHSDENRALYRHCVEARALAFERSDRWNEAADDLTWLTQLPLEQTRAVRAAWLRRLAVARDHGGRPAEAQRLRQEADLHERIASIPTTASPIRRLWPLVEHLVMSLAPDPTELQEAIANARAIAQSDGHDGHAAYAQGRLELTAGDPRAVASLTTAASLLPPGSTDVYYWRARARAVAGDLQGCLDDCTLASASPTVPGWVQQLEGYAYYGLGHFSEALDRFVIAVAAAPSLPDAHQGLVLTRARLREWEQTIAAADHAVRAGISDPAIHAARGEAALNLGRFDDALADCSRALTLSVTSIYAYRVRGVVQIQRQRWAEAVSDLTAALNLDPRDGISYSCRAEAYRMQRQLANAIADADLAVSFSGDLAYARMVRALITVQRWEVEPQSALLDSAELDAAWMVAAEPASALGYWVQAVVQHARGKTAEALSLATHAVQRDPTFGPAYRTRAAVHFSHSAWSDAARDFENAIEHGRPGDRGESYFGLAECQRIQGEVRASIENYDRSIAHAPEYGPAYHGRGLAYFAAGNWAEASRNYTDAITHGLRLPELYRARALAHYYGGRDEAAVADYEDAFGLETNPVGTLLEWGAMLVWIGQPAEGVRKLSEAVSRDTASDEGYARRGWARGVAGDLPGALADVSRAIDLNPKTATHFNNRAWVLCKLQRWADAVSDCNEALALEPSLDYALKNRSMAQWCFGRPADTLRDLTELVRLRQESGTAPAARRDDLFNWEDQAREWASALTRREGDAVGWCGFGIALWMSRQPGAAEVQIRRALRADPQLEVARVVIAAIEAQRGMPISVEAS